MTIVECVNEKTALNLNPFHGLINRKVFCGTLGNLVESIIEQIDFSDLNDVDKQSRWCCHQD